MKYPEPLKEILIQTRTYWDHDGTSPVVRRPFLKMLQCRTPDLGAEVFGLGDHELIVYHTCKSRACPSCGHRGNMQWLRERWVALPDMSYKGITFTMPDALWPFFRNNPHLARSLPALAATVIQAWASARFGLRVGVIAILHTFNGQLNFNSHVHTMVTGGGLQGSTATWISSVYYDREALTKSWRKAVVKLLRAALVAAQLHSKLAVAEIESLLNEKENVWWSLKIQTFRSKNQFLKYAGRYVRRPPIAQRRITYIGKGSVKFWFRDKKLHRRIEVSCSMEEFVDRWGQHIGEFYQHAVRSFGLFSPRNVQQTSAAIFTMLGQKQGPRPKSRPWADSLKRDFGIDPLLHHSGRRMKWRRRLEPKVPD